MAEVLSGGRADGYRPGGVPFDRRILRRERSADIGRQTAFISMGASMTLRRARSAFARFRELSAECRALAARRARRADDAEPAAISRSRCSARCAPDTSWSIAIRSIRRANCTISLSTPAPRRSWSVENFAHVLRAVGRGHAASAISSSPASAIGWAWRGRRWSISCCATSSARCRRGGCRGASPVQRRRSRSGARQALKAVTIEPTTSLSCNTPAAPPAFPRARC